MFAAGLVALLGFIAGLTCRQRRWLPLGMAAALHIFVPSAVGIVRLGAPFPSLHLGSIFMLTLAAAWAITKTPEVTNWSLKPLPPALHILMALIIVAALFNGTPSPGGYGLIFNQILIPYVLFVLCYNTARFESNFPRTAAFALIAVSTVEAAISILVWNGLIAQPWHQFWWANAGDRQLGTLDHALHLGLLMSVTLPFVTYIKNAYLQFGSFSLIVFSAVLTQSRLAILGCAICIAYLLLARVRASRRIGFLVAATAGYFVVSNLDIASSIRDRIADDQGSTRAREIAWSLYGDTWHQFIMWGVGPENQYFRENGLGTSGESALILYTIAFGILVTIAYFAVALWIILSGLRRFGLTPGVLSATIAIGMIQFYSSIGYESAAGVIVWFAIFLAATLPHPKRRAVPLTNESSLSTPSATPRDERSSALAGDCNHATSELRAQSSPSGSAI